MKVLIADNLPEIAIQKLREAGFDIRVQTDLKDEFLTEAIGQFLPDVLVVRSTRVGRDHLEAWSGLQLVVRAGAGVNTIDLLAASERAIAVANCPGMNAVAVAELAFGHILNADRRIADNVRDWRSGTWRKKHYSKAQGIQGQTLGIIGCGAIGQAMIKRAHAFEMSVVVYSPSLTESKAARLKVLRASSPLEVAQMCSILSVHLPLTNSTAHLVNAQIIAALPDGAMVINTSRGGIVDEKALAHAIETRGFRAGLDVFDNEPSADGPFDNPFADLDGAYGTHHIGASTNQAQQAVALEAVRVIIEFSESGNAPNCVNIGSHGAETHQLVVRHFDRVGVLAWVLDQLRIAELNVQSMENVIYAGENGAACATIRVEGMVSQDVVDAIGQSPDVINVTSLEL